MTATAIAAPPVPRQLKIALSTPCPECAGLGELEATDLFCGAGGSSLGLENVRCHACGRSLIRVTQALNHWDLAVDAHNANFPDADHDVHSVQDIPPSRFRRTPLFWASPECTHHAYCRGPKSETPEADRSRATFYDVVRFTEFHRYDAVIIENVIEARLWCDVRGHKEKCSCGHSFNKWHADMLALGYESEIVYFNSQFALPTPQSRDRMYVVFWRKGLPRPNLNFQPLAWCSHCETVVRSQQTWKKASKGSLRTQDGMHRWGRYGAQYLYTCLECGNAAAPAVTGAKTAIDFGLPMERIGDKKRPLAPKTRERIRGGLVRIAGLDPVTVQVGGNLFERRPGVRVWSVNDPMRTVVGTSQLSLVVRYGGQGAAARADGEPMQTITAHDRQIGLVVPNMEHNVGGSTDEPVGAVTSGNRHMLVQVNRSTKGKPNDRLASTLDEPTRTIAGHGELAIVEMQNHGSLSTLDEPTRTVYGEGYHQGLLVYNGVPGFVRDLGDAAGTVTGRDKQSLLIPYNRTGVARDTEEPMGTLTTKDRQALVVSDADIDDCLFRMLQWPELLRAQQMHEHGDGRPYELTAKRRDKRGKMKELSNEQRVKMIGNAVSSPVSTMLGYALMEVLAA